VVKLRPGRAGSNTAANHIEVLTEAIAQIPAPHRRRMLITCDGAGSTHALVSHISALNSKPGFQVYYSVGFDFDERVRAVIGTVPPTAWQPALDAHGNPRDDAQVAELTGLLRHSHSSDRLAGWPPDMRIIIRRETRTPARNCRCSNTTPASATRSSPPTPPVDPSSSSKPLTAPKPGSMAAALDTMAREELGLDPDELGSPWSAAFSSLIAFGVGTVVVVLP
jgi:hypothetical protein